MDFLTHYNGYRVYYVAGLDLPDAKERAKDPLARQSSPRLAYDHLGYFDTEENSFDVFEFKVREEIMLIRPPYRSER